jgi:hypothetical protein
MFPPLNVLSGVLFIFPISVNYGPCESGWNITVTPVGQPERRLLELTTPVFLTLLLRLVSQHPVLSNELSFSVSKM